MELMRKTLCDVGHTDMSEMPYCFFSPDITKGRIFIMRNLGDYEGAFFHHGHYEGGLFHHEKIGELK